MKRLRCNASFTLWIILCLFSAAFLSLSCWQFSKGMTKNREMQLQQHVNALPEPLYQRWQQWRQNPVSIQDAVVAVSGELDLNTIILHDNRILNRQPGYHLYAPLALDEPLNEITHLLVNMGWVPIPNYDRSWTPRVQLKDASEQVSLELAAEHIYDNIFTLDHQGPQRLTPTTGPNLNELTTFWRVQTIQLPVLETMFGIQLVPFVARVKTSITMPSLIPVTESVAQRGISPAKHFGYAVQWFIFWCIGVGVFFYTQCYWYDSHRN